MHITPLKVYDYDMVTYRKALPKLPAEKTVTDIVAEYLTFVAETRRGKVSFVIKPYFFVTDGPDKYSRILI